MKEIEFFVPIREDKYIGNGKLHPYTRWEWLEKELYIAFEGWTKSPMNYNGVYKDEDTNEMVPDESRKYTVAIKEGEIVEVKKLLKKVAMEFRQKSIYLSIAGKVIFIKRR